MPAEEKQSDWMMTTKKFQWATPLLLLQCLQLLSLLPRRVCVVRESCVVSFANQCIMRKRTPSFSRSNRRSPLGLALNQACLLACAAHAQKQHHTSKSSRRLSPYQKVYLSQGSPFLTPLHAHKTPLLCIRHTCRARGLQIKPTKDGRRGSGVAMGSAQAAARGHVLDID